MLIVHIGMHWLLHHAIFCANATEGICPVDREDGAALLEPEAFRNYQSPHPTGDRHSVLAPHHVVARYLLAILAEGSGAKSPGDG